MIMIPYPKKSPKNTLYGVFVFTCEKCVGRDIEVCVLEGSIGKHVLRWSNVCNEVCPKEQM